MGEMPCFVLPDRAKSGRYMHDIDPILKLPKTLRKLKEQGEAQSSKLAKFDEITSEALAEAEWLAEEAPKWEEASKEHPEFYRVIDLTSAWAASSNVQAQGALDIGRIADEATDELLARVQFASDVVMSTGGTACSSAVEAFSGEVPSEVREAYGLRPFRESPPSAMPGRLDGWLEEIDPELPSLRAAAWQALRQRASGDYLRHAATSMRELLGYIFDKLAPDDEVKKCDWWKPTTPSQTTPTKRDKLRYLIWGPSAPEDPALFDLLDGKINLAYESWKGLCEGVHTLNAKPELVEASIRDVESALLLIADRHPTS